MGIEVSATKPDGARARLAELLRRQRAAGGGLRRAERERPLPLSSAQRRLWFLDRLGREGAGYNVLASLRLEGPLLPAVLARALGEIGRRHEVLRTVYRDTAEGPQQRVLPPGPLPLPLEPLDRLPAAKREAALAALRQGGRERSFDLVRGPILRARLCRLAPEEHVLLLGVHHIAFDGWSLGVLTEELARLYDAFAAGRPSPLPEPAWQYADYAATQQARLAEGRHTESLDYWRVRLAGLAPAPLPADRPRGREPVGEGRLPLRLPADLAAAVEAAARQGGTTAFVVLATALQVLLHRVTGSERPAIGSPVAGREEAALEPLIGLFVNLVTLDLDCSGDPGFATLLARGRETALAAFRHQDAPLERVVEELGGVGGAGGGARGRSLPFSTVFALQAPPARPRFEGGLRARSVALDTGNRFELEVYLWREGEGYAGVWFYDAALFEAATMTALRDAFVALLSAALREPERPVARLSLADAEAPPEPQGPVTHFPRESLPALVAGQAERAPTATALRDGEEALSYAELEARAGALAGRLIAAGVRPGDVVAVAGERSAALVVAFLAVLKAGAAYLPLDPAHPAAARAAMLADAAPALLLLHPGAEIEPPEGLPTLRLEPAAWSGPPAAAVRVPPEAAAYVNYTSGSTGRPKGIVVPHRAVARLVRETDYIRLGPGDRVAHASNTAFDAATFEIWGALANGTTVVVAKQETVLDPEAYADFLAREAITALFLTTSLFNRVAERRPAAFAGVATAMAGGEKVDPRWIRRVLEAGPPGRLLNVYGPTESTTFALWHPIEPGDAEGEAVPIGRPLANTTAHLVDAALNPVPPGLPGELLIGGEGLAWGYLDRPDLTAERFVPDPFSARPGARLYRSGDRCRRDARGAVVFLDRLDRQVKIRGFRVEPAAVEAVLRSLPGVAEAAVLPRREMAGTWRLDAYVVAAGEGAESRPEALRRALAERLPPYAVPAAIALLPALPLGPTGKLDPGALPPIAALLPAAGAGTEAAAEPPADETEARVAAVMAELLECPVAGRHDDFFDLGGHSLLATSLASRLRDAFGVELPLARVFSGATAAGLAAALREAGTAEAAPPLRPAGREGPLPLSFAQRRLWFLDQLGLCGAAYHCPVNLRLTGRPDAGVLQRALAALAERHEALRTVFAEREGQPVQVILPPAPPEIRAEDLSGLAPGARQRALRRLVDAENARPFELSRDRPFRALLVRLSEEETVLAATFHHIAFDGSSLAVFLRELEALYRAAIGEAGAAPPELPLQYADFAVWQREWLDAARLGPEIEHWRARLAEVPPLELPGDRARPAVEGFRGGHAPLRLPPALAEAVRAAARRHGTTPFVPLLAGFQALLQRYSGQPRFAVGSPIANRTRSELEGLIGFFVNTLVLDADFSDDPGFDALVERTRGRVLEAFEHQHLPFEVLVEALQPERSLGRNPLFQVVFALQPAAALAPRFELPELQAEWLDLGVDTVRFDLELHLWEEEGGFSGWLFYNSDLFEPETARRWAAHYRALLEAALAQPAAALSGLQLVSDEELRQIEAWSTA